MLIDVLVNGWAIALATDSAHRQQLRSGIGAA
jgi:hypothetical protein